MHNVTIDSFSPGTVAWF